MVKKKRNSPERGATGHAARAVPAAHAPAVPAAGLPAEAGRGDWTAAILALMMFLTPALGVPHEQMLQDTLKSIVVSFAALGAALLFFWHQRQRREPLRWHGVVWLPLLLAAYALGSMAWSHTYLAGVEAIRWFVFSLLVWLGLNTLSRERLPLLAWGVHAGAAVASLWVALQFWVDFQYFSQGPNPASTFVNRNFFSEFAVCTLPFAALLLARARQSAAIALLSASSGLVLLAILMTGTRSALIALWVQLLLVLPLVGWRYRRQFAFSSWGLGRSMLAAGVLLGMVVGLGLIPTGNSKLIQEGRGPNALGVSVSRAQSISKTDSSLSTRLVMWKATARIIAARPVTGVGAGAWESEVPLYQVEGSQLETDYYVHNEFLQLLAEYGVAGWLFLLLLVAYLLASAWRTWRDPRPQALAEAPLRALMLCALLALFIVSNAGFPWRMATTGALFAVCLAALAASDARLGIPRPWGAAALKWQPAYWQAGVALALGGLALAAYITQQAAESERKIVKATQIALTISASGDPANPRWDKRKAEMLRLIREGTQINPHYRKITPMVADELARWGDWKNATWIWESVLSSRPHVVAIMTNVARGYAAMGRPARALAYLERAKKVQPTAPSVRSLEVILVARMGREQQAVALARQAVADGLADYDMLNAAFMLGWRTGDFSLALRAMNLRLQAWPANRANGYLQLGHLYANGIRNADQALASYQRALALTPPPERPALLAQIPPDYRSRLGAVESAPAATPQTSASSR